MKKILKKLVPSLLIVLFIGLLFGKAAWDSAKNNLISSEDIAAADLPEYLNITGLRNGILYGMDKRTSSGFRFCSYDASGQLYSHGFIAASRYSPNNYCFAGEENSTCYFPLYANENKYRLYSYSSTTPLRFKILCKAPYATGEISSTGTDFLYSKQQLKEKKDLEETICLYNTETEESKELLSFQFNFQNERQYDFWKSSVSTGGTYSNWNCMGSGEHLYWFGYAPDGLIYTYLLEATQNNGQRYLLRSYDFDGNLKKTVDLTEVLNGLDVKSIRWIKIEGDILFYHNSQSQSLFIDISTETPQVLYSDLKWDYDFRCTSGDDWTQLVSIYLAERQNALMLLNRETKEFAEYPTTDFGIEGSVNSVCVDQNGNVVICSTKTGITPMDDQALYYFGTLSNGTLTNVHPLTESDLSFRPTTDE